MKINIFTKVIGITIGLGIISLLMSLRLDIGIAFSLVFGSVLVIFLPGFMLTGIIYKDKKIPHLERYIQSLVFSMVIVPLVMLLVNLVGLPLTQWNILIVIVSILIVEIIVFLIGNKRLKK